MKDALGIELRLGQRVAIPCNSKFKIGILYNYRPNQSKHYLEMVEYVAHLAQGVNPDAGVEYQTWRQRHYTQKRVDDESHKYFLQFPDGKKRTIYNINSILGIPDDAEENANGV